MNIREFRNNFCKIAVGNEIVTVTKRNEVIGTYTPRKNTSLVLCERSKFNQQICKNVGTHNILVNLPTGDIKAFVCDGCFAELLSNLTDNMEIKEL